MSHPSPAPGAAPAAEQESYPRGASRIWTDIDLDAQGASSGYYRLPHSVHEHTDWLPIPVMSFSNGEGPRILLMGGNHGDEFEGQVLLMKLMRSLEVSNVRGQIIVLPAANAPAAFAGTRTSPLDGGNLNRSFPGDPDGSPTSQIAHFIESVLLPRVDHVFDFHSGGASYEMMPSAHVFHSGDTARFEQALHHLRLFGMPHSVVVRGLIGNDVKLFGACERAGVSHMSTELGGGGKIDPFPLARAEEGLARLLFELGAIRHRITDAPVPPPPALITRLPTRKYRYAYSTGLFEPYVVLGQQVVAGQEAGAIHNPEAPWREPEIVRFDDDGMVFAVRARAQTRIGDGLFMQAVPWTE